MEVKRHHKIVLGGFSIVIIIFMIVTGILLNTILVKIDANYNSLDKKITGLELDTQGKINTITESIIESQNAILNINQSFKKELGGFKTELSELKASAGEDFSGIIEDSVTSVVTIKTDISQGTGFLISEDGFIVTNYHIIEGAKQAGIYTYDKEMHQVTFVGANSQLDLALLKIEGKYDELKLGDSNDVQVGEKVIAIGNPLGLQFSVSQGIISAIHRTGSNNLEAYIQTDAALNPGNSGGPLINEQGKVIGINNFKISGGENLGFALESNYIKEAVNDIYLKKFNETLI
jgi:S1-C subfamily serine protease